MKKISIAVALAVAAIFSAISARADHFAYMSVNGGDFGMIDLDTGAFSLLGNSGQTLGGFGVAYGKLYTTSLHSPAGTLYTVNPANGHLTAVGDSSVSVDCFGSTTTGLFAIGTDANLYSINPVTAAATLIGPIGLSLGSWRTLGPTGTALYFGNGPNLYTLNTTTGAATLVGNMGGPQVGSLLLEGGILYGGQETPDFRVATLNPLTGVATNGPALTGTSNAFYALAPNPLPDYAATIKDIPNLLGYWRFSPASQANSEVNGYTGTFVGSAAVGPVDSGPSLIGDTSNTAALLDGTTNTSVNTSLTGQIDQQGSVIGWFYLAQLPSDAGRAFYIAGESQNGNDFDIQIDGDNRLRFYTEGGSNVATPSAFTAADFHTWHFFAATFTASSSRNLYLDGRLVASNVPGGHSANTSPFSMGDSTVFSGRFFNGRLDEIAIFNRELSATDVAGIYAQATQRKLLNISTRLRVQTGDNALIGGFILTGTDQTKVIIRGIGPSLSAFFSGALADPTLELYQGSTLLATNDNWKSDQQAEIEATGIPPGNDFESAIVRTLAPGSYTAVLRGKGDTTGIGVVEAYDLDPAANSRLANISTRGFVETGDNVMIGGLIIGAADGAGATVVVRAIGPTLSNFGIQGALQDPTLDLVNADGVVIRSNNDWRESQAADIIATGLQPGDDRESTILQMVAPGNYTAIVRGAGNTTGVGLVEVYHLP
jgi:hypothetical protein